MTAVKAHRGRPKGSGIDDQQKLVQISRLISADPRMKPTTAIKAIGVTDPSTIRRLRDKFTAGRSRPAGIPANPVNSQTPLAPTVRPAVLRVAALRLVEPTKRAEPAPQPDVIANLSSPSLMATTQPNQFPVAAMLFGFGLNAAAAIFEQQMLFAQSMMKLPPVREIVRSHLFLTEFMLSVARPSPGSRPTH